MKRTTYILLTLMAGILLLAGIATAADISSAGVKGKWSQGATWVGGAVPGATDNVTIVDGDTVTFDAKNGVVNNLTVGQGTSGVFLFSKVDTTTLTVNGNIDIKAGAVFRVQSRTVTGSLVHKIFLYGNLTNSGNAFDMRTGSSGSTLGVCNFVFVGSGNNTIKMGAYTSSANEFNGMTIDKSGNGRVILASDVTMAGGSSSEPAGNPDLVFKRGLVETKEFAMIALYTAAATTIGGSDSSYVLGALGRGMSNSGSSDRYFEVGDAKGFRPVKVRCATSGSATGHYIRVQAISGNANTGTSTFTGDIDKVSEVRYYKVGYFNGGVGATSMTLNRFSHSYGLNDGVAAGNQNLRIAWADSNRAIWKGVGPTTIPYTTALDSLPRMMNSDSVSSCVLQTGTSLNIALARLTGTTENSLKAPATAVEPVVGERPSRFSVHQNYPNPFNPSTTIEYSLPRELHATVTVFNMLGQEIATLVSERQTAGTYRVAFDAKNLPSGLYMYQVRAGEFVQARKMMLVK
jgi:hypothetical protein